MASLPKVGTGQRLRRSSLQAQRRAACVVPVQDAVPNLLRALSEPEQLSILRIDYTFVGKESDVEGATPIFFTDQHDRHRLDFAGLHQGQDLEQFVHRPKAT